MLQKVLNSAGLDARTCATLIRVNPTMFSEWLSGQRVVPESLVPMLAAVFAVDPSLVTMPVRAAKHVNEADIIPQIWYKFRGPGLIDSDRECVVLIRQLGHYVNQLEAVTKQKSVQWKTIFESIRATVDPQAPPREQGKMAARMFRESTSMGHGARASGEIIRTMLRTLGILLIETPLKDSRIEGCGFYVGATNSPRPCVFANTYNLTWFRRNVVLMHEVGHSIFDPFAGASIDLIAAAENEVSEIRAQAFAQESLVPSEVISHAAQHSGIKWNALTASGLARLVAETHVELRCVLASAADAGLISEEAALEMVRVDIATHLREISEHALSTDEYLEKIGEDGANWVGKRTTTLPSRPIRLPIGYVKAVVEAYQNRQISLGKASEFLMIDEADFRSRFSDAYEEVEAEAEVA